MSILQCSKNGRAPRAEARCQHLLGVARRLFVAQGFHATGVAQLAAESGIKVGQIYRDFASKEDIIAAIAHADLSRFLDESALETAIAARDLPAIRRWVLSFVTYDDELDGYRLMPEITAEAIRNPRIARLQQEMTDRVRCALTRALATCAPGDEHAQARREVADLMTTLGAGLCQWMVMEADGGRDFGPVCTRLRALAERELDFLCGTVAPRTV